MYDMPAMFRLIQLWLNLAAEKEINQRMEQAFKAVPSFKFLSLVYQMASRMTSSRSGPLFQSGFQVLHIPVFLTQYLTHYARHLLNVITKVTLLTWSVSHEGKALAAVVARIQANMLTVWR